MKKATTHDKAIQWINNNLENDSTIKLSGLTINHVGRTLKTFIPILENGNSQLLYDLTLDKVRMIKLNLDNK